MTQPLQKPGIEALSVKQVAIELGVSTYTVQKLISAGQIRAANVGTGQRSHFRVARADLDAYYERARADTARRFGSAS